MSSLPVPALALAFALALAIAGPSSAATDACPRLDGDAARALSGWQVPGAAVGAVRGGETVLRRTYGVRDVETGTPVGAETLFALGSITKSLTGLATAIAAENGAVSLDAPVRGILPYFPPDISLRHLLTHTAGWPRHEALWYLDAYGREELPRRLSLLPRFATPGAAFQYNNVPFAAAGVALAAVEGQSWDEIVRRTVLDPAGMADAVTTVDAFRAAANRAAPYFPGEDGRISIPLRDTDPVAPAAGLYAHLDDMLRYAALFADGGNGKVPANAVRAALAPSTKSYGLGLNLSAWRGREMAYHPGVVDGYGARIAILPAERIGIVVMTNMSGATPVAQILAQTVADCLLGEAGADWVARFGGGRTPSPEKPAPPPPVAPDRPVAEYAGRYEHAAYGAFVISSGPDGTILTGSFHGRAIALTYAGNDRWRLAETQWPLREGLILAFSGRTDAGFDRIATPLADGPTYRHNAGPLIFSRSPLH